MDPLTITAAVGSLTATVYTLTRTIGAFVSAARNARSDLDAVSRELVSLQICLEVLQSDRWHGMVFGSDLEVSINQVLVNTQVCCGQIETMLANLKASRYGRPVEWAWNQKDRMNQLRTSLETHKSALQMALQLNTVSILVKHVQRPSPNSSSESPLTWQDSETRSGIQRMEQKIDGIAQRQENDHAMQRLQEAVAELSSSIKDVASRGEAFLGLAQQSGRSVHNTLAVIEHIQGASETRTKVEAILQNPFADPFNEAEQATEQATLVGERHSSLNTQSCPVCQRNLTLHEYATIQPKLQQLQSDWHRQWPAGQGEESRLHKNRTRRPTPATSGSMHGAPLAAARSPYLHDSDSTSLLSETGALKMDWADDDDNSSLRESATLELDRQSTGSVTTTKLQQLQVKYDSACQRIQVLAQEVTAFETENSRLQTAHAQDIARLQARLVRAQEVFTQLDALRKENQQLSDSIRQANLPRLNELPSGSYQLILTMKYTIQSKYDVNKNQTTRHLVWSITDCDRMEVEWLLPWRNRPGYYNRNSHKKTRNLLVKRVNWHAHSYHPIPLPTLLDWDTDGTIMLAYILLGFLSGYDLESTLSHQKTKHTESQLHSEATTIFCNNEFVKRSKSLSEYPESGTIQLVRWTYDLDKKHEYGFLEDPLVPSRFEAVRQYIDRNK